MWVSEEVRASQEETVLHPSSRQLLAAWDEMRAGRPAPSRRDLDLRQVKELMSQLFIAERDKPSGGFTWRLAGTGLCSLHARELTGTDMLAGWEDFERGVFHRFLSAVTGAGQIAQFRIRFLTDRQQTFTAEMLALPMQATDASAIHILGGLFPFREAGLRHYESLAPAELTSARFITPDLARDADEATPAAPMRRFQVIAGGRR